MHGEINFLSKRFQLIAASIVIFGARSLQSLSTQLKIPPEVLQHWIEQYCGNLRARNLPPSYVDTALKWLNAQRKLATAQALGATADVALLRSRRENHNKSPRSVAEARFRMRAVNVAVNGGISIADLSSYLGFPQLLLQGWQNDCIKRLRIWPLTHLEVQEKLAQLNAEKSALFEANGSFTSQTINSDPRP
jgi:hypothetical protein